MCSVDFSSDYFNRHLITYIGNKRKLLKFINTAIDDIKIHIGNQNPTMLDGFSGSGIVARMFKSYAGALWVNDFENYSETLNNCYLTNQSEAPLGVNEIIDVLNSYKLDDCPAGFIARHYAPKDDDDIKPGERVFYTAANARIIDNIRRLINETDVVMRPFLIAPLLVKASMHTNTSGVFRFHKKDHVGHFGGGTETALARIKKEIHLDYPVFSDHETEVHVLKGDMNRLVDEIPEMDIVYYDPPYNQHPYGSNYFMLNLINNYDNPEIQDGVCGILKTWNRSAYNKRQHAEAALDDLIAKTKAKYILISYNGEGIIPLGAFQSILERYGVVERRERPYYTYRGSQNFGKGKMLKAGGERAWSVQELLWILKR